MAALRLLAFALLVTAAIGKDEFWGAKKENFAEQKCLGKSLDDINDEIQKRSEGKILHFLTKDDISDSEENIIEKCLLKTELQFEAIAEKARKTVKSCGLDSPRDLEDHIKWTLKKNNFNLERLIGNHDFDTCEDINCNIQAGCKILETGSNSDVIMKGMVAELIMKIMQYSPDVRDCIFAAIPGFEDDLGQIISDNKKCWSQIP